MVHAHQAIPEALQLALLEELLKCEARYHKRAETVQDAGGSNFERLFGVTIDWVDGLAIARLPDALCPRAAAATDHLVPAEYPTSFIDCFRYGRDGRLKAHVDCLYGWVMVALWVATRCSSSRSRRTGSPTTYSLCATRRDGHGNAS